MLNFVFALLDLIAGFSPEDQPPHPSPITVVDG
jgi:hypothetical protein